MPPAAQNILRSSNSDMFYYQVIDKEGRRLSGDTFIPGPYPNLQCKAFFRDAIINGDETRVARVRVRVPGETERVFVQVAETLNGRQSMIGQILLSIILPQILLIVLGALAVSLGISRGLAPLRDLEKALAQRTQFDLTAVSENNAPIEVLPLVQEINNLLARLRADIEFQKRFVANAAHQFRTPLAALKTYVYAAKRLPSDRRMNEVLDSIESGTNRMTHLADKLLALAKSEPSSKTEEDYVRIDLNLIASEVTADFISEALSKDVDLTFAGSDEPALISGNAENLTELASNLIENAILYTPAGGKIAVKIDCTDDVTLAVTDDGPGIPTEERDRVMERFYRVLGTEAPGSGLGLAIVKEIALAHNAGVQIDSGPNGKGTAVLIRFPSSNNGRSSA